MFKKRMETRKKQVEVLKIGLSVSNMSPENILKTNEEWNIILDCFFKETIKKSVWRDLVLPVKQKERITSKLAKNKF